VEPEGSLPDSRESTTGPYTELNEPKTLKLFPVRSVLVLSSHLRLGISCGLFSSSLKEYTARRHSKDKLDNDIGK
jgi:hypothetical protein